MDRQPKPGAAMVAAAAVVVAACMVATAAVLALFAARGDLCALSMGILLTPFPIGLGIAQYVATSRRNARAARTAAAMLLCLGGMASVALVALAAAWIEGGAAAWRGTGMDALGMVLVAGFSLWAGVMNLQWSHRIRSAARTAATEERLPERLQFSLADLLLVLTSVAVITGMTFYCVENTRRRFAEHVDRARAPRELPAEATDVSFCKGRAGTVACEFTTSEAGFVAWVESSLGRSQPAAGAVVQPIAVPVVVNRYFFLRPNLNGPATATVSSGLCYQWTDGSRGEQAVFDRTTNRAYYFADSLEAEVKGKR